MTINEWPDYICPRCGNPGFMSVYEDTCTGCANFKRGLGADPKHVNYGQPPISTTTIWNYADRAEQFQKIKDAA